MSIEEHLNDEQATKSDVKIDRPNKRRTKRKASDSTSQSSQLNIDLPDDLKLSLKLQAMQEDTTISELVRHYLTTNERMPLYEVKLKRAA